MIFWFTQQHKSPIGEHDLRKAVARNCEVVVKKAVSLARPPEAGNLPANQTVIDLISKSVDPVALAQCDALWMGWL